MMENSSRRRKSGEGRSVLSEGISSDIAMGTSDSRINLPRPRPACHIEKSRR